MSIISINAENTRKLLVYIREKLHSNFLLLKSGSISKEKFIKSVNEITVFLIIVIGVERTIKLFWNIIKIMIGCGYTIRYLIMKKNIENIENIENIDFKTDVNKINIENIMARIDGINLDIKDISTSVKNISSKLDTNCTSVDVLKKNVNFGVVGTDYYSPF